MSELEERSIHLSNHKNRKKMTEEKWISLQRHVIQYEAFKHTGNGSLEAEEHEKRTEK